MTNVKRGVYSITCLGSSHQYVGSSVDIAKRWRHHRQDLRNQTHHSRALQRAWNKWGPEEFHWGIIEEVAEDEDLRERERIWHRQLKPAYNPMIPDRALKDRHAAETLKRIGQRSLAAWKKRRIEGRDHHSASTKAKIASAHMGLRPDEEARRKMCASAKRRAERDKSKWETIRASRTTCAQGHPWTAENTYTYPSTGKTTCLTCKRAVSRESMRRTRQRPFRPGERPADALSGEQMDFLAERGVEQGDKRDHL